MWNKELSDFVLAPKSLFDSDGNSVGRLYLWSHYGLFGAHSFLAWGSDISQLHSCRRMPVGLPGVMKLVHVCACSQSHRGEEHHAWGGLHTQHQPGCCSPTVHCFMAISPFTQNWGKLWDLLALGLFMPTKIAALGHPMPWPAGIACLPYLPHVIWL